MQRNTKTGVFTYFNAEQLKIYKLISLKWQYFLYNTLLQLSIQTE